MREKEERLSCHSYRLIVKYTECKVKHIGEPIRAFNLACIPPINGFINITLKIFRRNKMISAENHSLEVSPKAFNGIGGDITTSKFRFRVIDELMIIAMLCKSVVALAFIGKDSGYY